MEAWENFATSSWDSLSLCQSCIFQYWLLERTCQGAATIVIGQLAQRCLPSIMKTNLCSKLAQRCLPSIKKTNICFLIDIGCEIPHLLQDMHFLTMIIFMKHLLTIIIHDVFMGSNFHLASKQGKSFMANRLLVACSLLVVEELLDSGSTFSLLVP